MSELLETPSVGGSRIVVGVDGSATARTALAWAADEALRRGATLQVISAFPSPTLLGVNPPAEYFATIDAEARQLIDDEIAQVPAVAKVANVVRVAVPESPGAALVAASVGAEMLVVGRRGRGGFSELLLGSVSNQCVHHAHCPVVVVREGDSS
jgi:nucleotide-binding universal stress UspA family protein